jgi:putative transposase
VRRQSALLGLNRSSLYYEPVGATAEDLRLMRLSDEEYTRHPFYGSRRLTAWLIERGEEVNRKRVQRLLRLMGLEAIYPKPNLSVAGRNHKVYPYLLRDVTIERPDQVWSADITSVPLAAGFLYLAATIDWYSRYVLAWRLSNTLDGSFGLDMLEEALSQGRPEVFNTDQGVQFTAEAWTSRLERAGVAVSRAGKGRCLDNVFVERLWRSVKTEATKTRCSHARCQDPYNRRRSRLSVGPARTGELVPRPGGFHRRTRTMPRPEPAVAPPRAERPVRCRRPPTGRTCRRAGARNSSASWAGC